MNFYFTKEPPPNNLINSKRHYFGEPVSNVLSEKIAESMWEKQRNEIAMKLKEKEEEKEKIKQGQELSQYQNQKQLSIKIMLIIIII